MENFCTQCADEQKRLYHIHAQQNWLKTLIKNTPTKKEQKKIEDSYASLDHHLW